MAAAAVVRSLSFKPIRMHTKSYIMSKPIVFIDNMRWIWALQDSGLRALQAQGLSVLSGPQEYHI